MEPCLWDSISASCGQEYTFLGAPFTSAFPLVTHILLCLTVYHHNQLLFQYQLFCHHCSLNRASIYGLTRGRVVVCVCVLTIAASFPGSATTFNHKYTTMYGKRLLVLQLLKHSCTNCYSDNIIPYNISPLVYV